MLSQEVAHNAVELLAFIDRGGKVRGKVHLVVEVVLCHVLNAVLHPLITQVVIMCCLDQQHDVFIVGVVVVF